MSLSAFSKYEIKSGLLIDCQNDVFPTQLFGWNNAQSFIIESCTYYGYIYKGKSLAITKNGHFELNTGMYFSIPHPFEIQGGSGIVIACLNYRGMFTLGGPVENWGRLKYIDGCTDSLLLPPIKLGDSCLNALFFPKGIFQTQHTHPSFRMGIVARGEGVCVTPEKEYLIKSGDVFMITAEGMHSFRTTKNPMTVIAYHPDSDYGPQDQDHPMLNRTIVNDQSAKFIAEIKTK